ncbi:leucine-rich repeat domain-containing protein [Cellulophaga baltica]|uniref:Ras of Complex, Roc, domain of DAPkinase n=1 Tax=Cellulophaga baltica TaxID=76594 RepID=A0A1G7JPL8_9FLAO|nr:leucine-rich repeat domain-containing protein [Cellulophaga baltica]SDF26795.1 Ras of Complex, Roc, domain of DAPkinase [Cellulophaga baltica]
MEKPKIVLQLEVTLKIELYITDYGDKPFLKLNRSVSIDEDKNIIALNLSDLRISDLSFLADLKDLQSLYLDSNIIEDLSFIKNLINLKNLSLNENSISDVDSLSGLINLEILNLSENNILNITALSKLKKIKHLNISSNNITDISIIKAFKNLKALYADDNSISDLVCISSLLSLKRINFSKNKITDISSLKKLKYLQEFIFSNNRIFDLSPILSLIKNKDFTRSYNFFENPLVYPPTEVYLRGDQPIIKWFEIICEKANSRIAQCLEKNEISLNLGNCGITDLTLIPELFKCIQLEELILSNEWAEYSDNDWTKVISREYDLENNLYEIPNQISKLKKIKRLIVGGDWKNNKRKNSWRIRDVKNLGTLTNLEYLNISNNKIYSVTILKKLYKLKHIHINNNEISSISFSGHFETLESLNASNNNLSSISFLKDLKSIKMLDIHSNKIENINDLESILSSLKKLVIDNNPFVVEQNWKLSKYENHLSTIENYFSKKNATETISYKLPVKVLLLGNHGAGKSTLLDYLMASNKRTRKIKEQSDSTHIVRIEKYPRTKTKRLPDIIYFDFGGQDYYHGIYNAFLTNDAINILLWNLKTNENKIRIDKGNNVLTRDFTKNYWLHQLKHQYADKENVPSNQEILKNEVVLVAQTHADEDVRVTENTNIKGINIKNEFHISLDQGSVDAKKIHKINLNFLESYLNYEIEEKKSQSNYNVIQPQWYGDFLNFIFNFSSEKCTNLKDLLKNYKRKPERSETDADIFNFLIEDLDQLHRQGLILYYKNFNELNDVVWLNPSLLTTFIHSKILTKEDLINNGGEVCEKKFYSIANEDSKIIKLLQLQKVVFHDKEHKKYIIPSFLPLANDIKVKNNYDILTFGLDEPAFTLKFKNFIPFGIVNQLICHFGNNHDSKFFWRDQLIFTLDNSVKVLIKLDFNNLEIFVFLSNKNLVNKDLQIIERYIFNCLIAIYHDVPLLAFRDYQNDQLTITINTEIDDVLLKKKPIVRNSLTVNFIDIINKLPDDLYISLDNEYFVKGTMLNSVKNDFRISSMATIAEPVQKSPETGENYIIRTLSKVHSKELPIYQFQNFTNQNLKKMKKIFISYSKDDLSLVHEFEDHLSSLKRDGIISTWYCTELIAGGEWDKDITKHFEEADIVCFMVSSNLMRTDYIHKYEIAKAFEKKENDESFKIVPIILDFCSWSTMKNNLSKFSALPYTAKPVCDFDNKNMAWYVIVECIRIMITSDEQPTGDDWFEQKELPKNIKNIYERIVNKSVDKNN